MWAEEPLLTCWWGGPEHMTCWMELDLLKGEHLCVCRGFSGFHSVLIEHSKRPGGRGRGSLAGPCGIPSEGVSPSTAASLGRASCRAPLVQPRP